VRVCVYEGDEGWGREINGLRLLVRHCGNASSKWQVSHAIQSDSKSAEGECSWAQHLGWPYNVRIFFLHGVGRESDSNCNTRLAGDNTGNW